MRCLLYFIASCLLAATLSSCHKEVNGMVDHLNDCAYRYHYQNLDSCLSYARKAYRLSSNYQSGRAEALNHLAFYHFMRMDFKESGSCLQSVYDDCYNEIELLIADIGMMKICQRTSANKSFYDHRNNALQRINYIREEQQTLNPHEAGRFTYALSEFRIVSSIYYYYLQQEEQSLEEINSIGPNNELVNDTAQLAYYYYMKGSGGLCEGETPEEVAVREFDYLSLCHYISKKNGYNYFEANCLQAFAELMLDNRSLQALQIHCSSALKLLNPYDKSAPEFILDLANQALEKFKQQGDLYQIAGTYRTIASCLIRSEAYQLAVDTLQRALDYVTLHHRRYYCTDDCPHRLLTYNAEDTLTLEQLWMSDTRMLTVPEWIARIREQLSMAYSGLGMKAESDYNRNIYLDILDVTRQDKELESRYDLLERESQLLHRWLISIIALLVLLILLSYFVNKWWKRKNDEQISNLRQILGICQKITASVPTDATDRKEIAQAIRQAIASDLVQLFGHCQVEIDFERKELLLQSPTKLNKDQRTMLKVLNPYVALAIANGSTFIRLGEERQRIEKEQYLCDQHIAENKRQNLDKKTCFAIVTGVTPYLDRVLNEINKLRRTPHLSRSQKRERYRYIEELIDKINEYNEILALWIKMKQGTLSLHIENFALNDLFDILNKGRKNFEAKQQYFTIEPTQAVVKADKALTLFMVNTLTENARKYTPSGGEIRLSAKESDNYVEISVQDTGIGLTEEDRQRILEAKVYDSSTIGMSDEHDQESLRRNKGSGFGLINCKGIIEKYKKTNALFRLCLFDIESTKGQGSRFFFRLPKGVMKLLTLLLLVPATVWANDLPYYDAFLERAAQYADSAYYSNVNGDYAQTICFVDSAIVYLNRHSRTHQQDTLPSMQRSGDGQTAEIEWWKRLFDTDYHVILDIRNEAAVASLALRNWEDYRYNNNAYARLYKLLSEDSSLERYCLEMQHSASNTTVGILLCLILFVVTGIASYLLYFRRRILYRLNLEQVLVVNHHILTASMQSVEDLHAIPQQILQQAFDSINDLLEVRTIAIALCYEETKQPTYSCYPSAPIEGRLCRLMQQCCKEKRILSTPQNELQCYPLCTVIGSEPHYFGAFCLERKYTGTRREEAMLAQSITRYLSVILMHVVIHRGNKYRDIELAEDDRLRSIHERNNLHVQNQVLDNCLSTIKHETLYYPNKIHHIVEVLARQPQADNEAELIANISELASYYKDIFTLLSSCAARQLEGITFRRTRIPVQSLIEHAQKQLHRLNKKSGRSVTLTAPPTTLQVLGDDTLLKYLLENLLEAAMEDAATTTLSLTMQLDSHFVRFNFSNTAGSYTQEELNQLFTPALSHIRQSTDGTLKGTAYLRCKQIIREHDEYTAHAGCRINAESHPEGGLSVWFTIPSAT